MWDCVPVPVSAVVVGAELCRRRYVCRWGRTAVWRPHHPGVRVGRCLSRVNHVCVICCLFLVGLLGGLALGARCDGVVQARSQRACRWPVSVSAG